MSNKKSRKAPSVTKDDAEKLQQVNLRIMALPEVSKGVYSNVALVQSTENEIVISFLLRVGEDTQLVSRVVLSPQHAKSLQDTLANAVTNFERQIAAVEESRKTSGK